MAPTAPSAVLSDEEKLTLARQVFKTWFARCFWSWDPDTVITTEHLPQVVAALRLNGGHEGYRLAGRLCR